MRNGNRFDKRFTLVELLVIISMITMLMGLLIPVLNKTKVMMDQTECINSIRNINLALSDLIQNNDNRYPSPIERFSPTTTWTTALIQGDYMEPVKEPVGWTSKTILSEMCPSNFGYANSTKTYYRNPYMMNGRPRWGGRTGLDDCARTAIVDPQNTVEVLCGSQNEGLLGNKYAIVDHRYTAGLYSQALNRIQGQYHDDHVPTSFTDGRVAPVSIDTYSASDATEAALVWKEWFETKNR